MKAEIINEMLSIIPQSKTEEYAIDKWYEANLINPCNPTLNGRNFGIYPYRKYKRSLKNRILLWLHNNRIRFMYSSNGYKI
jgi:hypothetical protein